MVCNWEYWTDGFAHRDHCTTHAHSSAKIADIEKVVGNDDNSVLIANCKRTTKLLFQHFRWKLFMMRLSSQADPFYSCI